MSHKFLRALAAGALSIGTMSYSAISFAAPQPDPMPGRPTPSTLGTTPTPGVPNVPESAIDHANAPAPREIAPTVTKGDSANFALSNKDAAAAKKTLAELHKVNALEIEVGKLAEDSGGSDQVKEFGKKLVDDHQAADSKIVDFAQSHNIILSTELPARRDVNPSSAKTSATGVVTPTTDAVNGNKATADQPGSVAGEHTLATDAPTMPPQLDAEGQRTLAKLQKLSGSKFDKQFATTMVQGHTKTLAKIKAAEAKVDNAEFKSLMEDLRGTVQQHLDHAKELQRGETSSVDAPSPMRSASNQ